jgi:large subunit ribosomal protein L6
MSRIGKRPIDIPSGVKVTVAERLVKVEGPKGKLEYNHNPGVAVKIEGPQVVVTRPDDSRQARSLHGLTRTIIGNMVEGVSKGYEIGLEINGVGYRAEAQGNNLTISVGLSSPVTHILPAGVTAKIEKQTQITLSSIDKQLLGVQAAKIRSYRPPEPYKAKGIKYATERIRRKVGKSGAG